MGTAPRTFERDDFKTCQSGIGTLTRPVLPINSSRDIADLISGLWFPGPAGGSTIVSCVSALRRTRAGASVRISTTYDVFLTADPRTPALEMANMQPCPGAARAPGPAYPGKL